MLENLNAWLPTIIAGSAMALLWSDIRNFKKNILDETRKYATESTDRAFKLAEETKSKAEESARILHNSLFRNDGETLYMPRVACEREQARCQMMTCGKIDNVVHKLDEMNKQREFAKELQMSQMGDIRQGLALITEQVEQLLSEKR